MAYKIVETQRAAQDLDHILCRAARLRRLGYRKAGIKNYIMIYKVREVDRSVQVLRFFHGKQAYERLI